ncbi:hypothetical protein CYMTET_36538, partial [Cymbomonas tetramitiformis]
VEAVFSTPDGYSIARNMLDDWVATKAQESESEWESPQAVPDVVISGRGQAPRGLEQAGATWSPKNFERRMPALHPERAMTARACYDSPSVLRQPEGRAASHLRAAYHTHILEHAQREVEPLELQEVVCVGGGRITYTDDAIKVYGESSAFGPADHGQTMKLLRAEFPFHDITYDQ